MSSSCSICFSPFSDQLGLFNNIFIIIAIVAAAAVVAAAATVWTHLVVPTWQLVMVLKLGVVTVAVADVLGPD